MIYKLIAVVSKDGFIARYSGDLPVNWTSNEEQDFFKKDIKLNQPLLCCPYMFE